MRVETGPTNQTNHAQDPGNRYCKWRMPWVLPRIRPHQQPTARQLTDFTHSRVLFQKFDAYRMKVRYGSRQYLIACQSDCSTLEVPSTCRQWQMAKETLLKRNSLSTNAAKKESQEHLNAVRWTVTEY